MDPVIRQFGLLGDSVSAGEGPITAKWVVDAKAKSRLEALNKRPPVCVHGLPYEPDEPVVCPVYEAEIRQEDKRAW